MLSNEPYSNLRHSHLVCPVKLNFLIDRENIITAMIIDWSKMAESTALRLKKQTFLYHLTIVDGISRRGGSSF